MTNSSAHFLQNAIERSEYYKQLGEASFNRLNDAEIHYMLDPLGNNIAVIVKHIAGNLLSRWTDFQNSDGEKIWRNRDTEFIDDIKDKEALVLLWSHGWACFLNELNKLSPEDLMSPVFIRNEKHTVLEAIQRQLNHNSYHIGQIVFLAKSIKGNSWKSLSIPKNMSNDFNKKMGM